MHHQIDSLAYTNCLRHLPPTHKLGFAATLFILGYAAPPLAQVAIAYRTRRIVWQNIIVAMAVKGIFITLGAVGIATLWEAVFADVGVALLAILNASRILLNRK